MAHEGIDRFEGGMRVTGGDARPDKSWTYLIEFQWVNGEWFGDCHPIEPLNVSEGRKMLGVLLAPDGNNSDALATLEKTAQEWVDREQTGHLRRMDARFSYQLRISRKIHYPDFNVCTVL